MKVYLLYVYCSYNISLFYLALELVLFTACVFLLVSNCFDSMHNVYLIVSHCKQQ